MGTEKGRSRHEELSPITKALKGLAMELSCVVIVLSQLSRSVESRQDKVPMLSDLRESGSIEEDADKVMFLFRPDYYWQDRRPGEADVIIAKNRNGPKCHVPVSFDGPHMRFHNLDRNDW